MSEVRFSSDTIDHIYDDIFVPVEPKNDDMECQRSMSRRIPHHYERLVGIAKRKKNRWQIALAISIFITLISLVCAVIIPVAYAKPCENASQGKHGTAAFSAYMSVSKSNQSTALKAGGTVVFDKVLTNENNVYNTNNGIFRAPTTGLYAFTWTICVNSRFDPGYGFGEFGTQLMYGSSVIGVLHADTEVKHDDGCSTGFVVHNVQSTAIDIYLKVIYEHQGKILSTNNQTRSTFTGWKLY